MEPLPQSAVHVDSWLSENEERSLANDVLDGLTKPFKELAPKHFYDARGSDLFEQICEQPEYYPTRTELAILAQRAPEIIETIEAGELVELGAGASDKARLLLNAMRDAGTLRRYVPLDVSQAVVEDAARTLIEDYGDLEVHGVVGDFERHLEHVPVPDGASRIVALLGGTIGNFPPGTRRNVLSKIAALLGPEDRLLLGTDLVKDRTSSRPPTTTRRASPPSSTATSCTSSTVSSTPTSSPTPSSTSPSMTAATSGSRCACGPPAR